MTTGSDKMRHQLYLLGALVGVLAVLAYVRFGPGDSAPSATAPAGGAAQPSNQATGTGGRGTLPVSDVRLDALQHEPGRVGNAERNPFRFKPKPAPAAPPVQRTPPQAYVPPPVETGPPPPPPIPLKYVGVLTPPGTPAMRYAVLSDSRGTPFYGKEGDLIEGRYRVLRVATESVDVAYADGRGRQTLRLISPPQ